MEFEISGYKISVLQKLLLSLLFGLIVVTDRSRVLPFCPNRTEQVNQSSVSRTKTEQNRTWKKAPKNLELNCRSNKQTDNFKLCN